MKTGISKIIVCLFLLPLSMRGSNNWSSGTANTLPKGRWEMGLFQSLRVGQTERIEWSIHPILSFQIPNISVKIAHPRFNGWEFATRHSLIYPTPLLRRLRLKGFGISTLAEMDVGGIISNDPDISQIPQMVSLKNEALLTKKIGVKTLLTGKGGISLVIKNGKLDSRTTIDLPIVFPRLGVYYNGYAVNLGADLLQQLTKKLQFLSDVDLILLPGADEDFTFEHKGLFIWNKHSDFRILVGYKLVYGEYPFGTQWHLLPLFDLEWGRSK